MKYVILGSLGNISKPLAQQLIAAGHSVTIVSSHAGRAAEIKALGATPAIGSIEDLAFLTATFRGNDLAYTMIPPKFDAKPWKQWIGGVGAKYASAAKESGLKKIVNLSSAGADQQEGVGPVSGLCLAEKALDAQSGADIRHIRAGYFYTNFRTAIGLIKSAGIYGNNYGADTSLVMVHPRDIAKAIAEEMQKADFTGSSVRYVASDERNSRDITRILGKAIDKPDLPYVSFSDEETRQGMLSAGLPDEVAQEYTEMGRAMRTGVMFADYKRHRPALSSIKLEDFAIDFAAAYGR